MCECARSFDVSTIAPPSSTSTTPSTLHTSGIPAPFPIAPVAAAVVASPSTNHTKKSTPIAAAAPAVLVSAPSFASALGSTVPVSTSTSSSSSTGTFSAAPAPLVSPISACYAANNYDNGIITACNNITYDEVMRRRLIGLPRANYDLIGKLKPGASAIFVLNMESKELYGVFEAHGAGALDIEPDAWNGPTGGKSKSSRFPAQCRFTISADFEQPLAEKFYKDLLFTKDPKNRIRLISGDETKKLIAIFQQRSKLRKVVAATPIAITAAATTSSAPIASSVVAPAVVVAPSAVSAATSKRATPSAAAAPVVAAKSTPTKPSASSASATKKNDAQSSSSSASSSSAPQHDADDDDGVNFEYTAPTPKPSLAANDAYAKLGVASSSTNDDDGVYFPQPITSQLQSSVISAPVVANDEYAWFTNFSTAVVAPALASLKKREQSSGHKMVGPD